MNFLICKKVFGDYFLAFAPLKKAKFNNVPNQQIAFDVELN